MILRPVLLCGGSGTRLWPLSRSAYPKQFMDLGGRTLFGDTVRRSLALPGAGAPLVLCNEEQRFLTAAALQAERAEARIILEPTARNTAPAIALAALAAVEEAGGAEDPLLLVQPCDHAITPQEAFNTAVQQAVPCAAAGRLVTFGITPDRPETGYGYMQQGTPFETGFQVDRFVEKPAEDKARAMLEEGGYFWNSGIFLFRASVYLNELKRLAPAVHEACAAAWAGHVRRIDFTRVPEETFAAAPAISIDYAVMEHTPLTVMVPLTAQWSDLGSWEAFYTAAAKDAEGNAVVGDVICENTASCYLHSTRRLVAAFGLSDLAVVETGDAVLVAPRSETAHLKCLVDRLKKEQRPETDLHLQVHRPWGCYEVLAPHTRRAEARFQVKRIEVKPGAALSLQLHHHRAEHWVVVSGTAEVTVGDKTFLLREDESTYIPLGTVHRLKNPGRIPLSIIEIQSGSYLGEDDIVRLEDTYGR